MLRLVVLGARLLFRINLVRPVDDVLEIGEVTPEDNPLISALLDRTMLQSHGVDQQAISFSTTSRTTEKKLELRRG